MKRDRLHGLSHVPRAVGRRDGVREREADGLAARALAGRPLPRREPAAATAARDASGGQPLDPRMREFFEGRFGHDFGRVRIHAGASATEAARELDADAFTFGHDIFVRDERDARLGAGDPRLLAHELAHVVQAVPGSLVQRKIRDPRGPVGLGPGDYAQTFREYLLYLHSMKGAKGPQPGFNPYVKPTIDQVLFDITMSPAFRDEVVEAYDRIYLKDLVEDIVRYSTEEERDRLLRPFVSGPGDFPERPKDKGVA